MKSSYLFRDQVGTLTGWFKSWNKCEQTVALCSLLLKLAPAQAKFLLQVLEHSVAESSEVQLLESQANNSVYISSLCSESKEYAVSRLLACLPLLRAGNTAAKAEYLRIIPKVLAHSIDRQCHLEESRQLVSYSLIHPAIAGAERALLSQWLSYLPPEGDCEQNGGTQQSTLPVAPPGMLGMNGLQRPDDDSKLVVGGRAITSSAASRGCSGDKNVNGQHAARNEHAQLHATHSVPAAFTNVPPTGNTHRKLARSSSITPPTNASTGTTNVSDWLNCCLDDGVGRHAPLSPQSSASSSGSGSEIHGDDTTGRYLRNTFLEEGSGMREVPIWLKSLRLHKYASLFQQMTYEEMLQLTDAWLESKLVTKGARHKILLNVARLQKRQSVLRSLEKEIMESGNIKQAMTEIRSLLALPLKAFTRPAAETAEDAEQDAQNQGPSEGDCIAQGDVPGQFTRVLGKLCTQLLVSNQPDNTCFSIYLQLLDKCYLHEAFSNEQKKKLLSWRQQIQQICHMRPMRYNIERQRKSQFSGVGQRALRGQPPPNVPPQQLKPDQTTWTFGALPTVVLGVRGVGPGGVSASLYNPASTIPPYEYLPRQAAMFDIPLKQPIGRTHSAPSQSNPLSVPISSADLNETEPEINARLDSLCLSMTEHALAGSFDSPDRGSTF